MVCCYLCKMKKVLKTLLIIFFISFPYEANAISPGPFIKAFKGLGKLFKKGADEIPDIGKKIEDLRGGNIKSGSKIDETISSSSNIDNANSIKFNETTLFEVENLNRDKLLEAHNIKKNKRMRDADQLLDIIDSVDVASDVAQTAVIVPFIQTEWQGRIFKSSSYFNNPSVEKRILIMCESNLEDFYFTALFDKKGGNWFLLSGNFTNKNPKRYYIRPMKRQELLVLKDLDEYLYFSNKPKGIKKYPTKYFIINNDAKFFFEKNISEKKDPDLIINELLNKIEKSSFSCKRTL